MSSIPIRSQKVTMLSTNRQKYPTDLNHQIQGSKTTLSAALKQRRHGSVACKETLRRDKHSKWDSTLQDASVTHQTAHKTQASWFPPTSHKNSSNRVSKHIWDYNGTPFVSQYPSHKPSLKTCLASADSRNKPVLMQHPGS